MTPKEIAAMQAHAENNRKIRDARNRLKGNQLGYGYKEFIRTPEEKRAMQDISFREVHGLRDARITTITNWLRTFPADKQVDIIKTIMHKLEIRKVEVSDH